ncbi:LacI family DNA-binding transcriptional regulator [Vibrio maerlii]|uniref:LacI family DNA-binding transcriptional regulator n=1 Tax=Vibrio maerlii TaxID=2231648 RepID=UPI0013DEE478|nr:LacI family DNA-binding transcriptional regulator [Vibrio maerlii]
MNEHKTKSITSVDVAKAAGVSRAAVSRTFSNNGYVSQETKQKVMEAANVLGYRVNHLARSLNRQRSDLIGLVVADMDNPFRSQQVSDLSEAILATNHRPLLIPTKKGRDSSQVIDMLLHYNVSGVVITSDTPPESIFKMCADSSVPVVLVNKQDTHDKIDRVICDNHKGIELLVSAFSDSGCERVTMVSSKKDSFSIRNREQMFCELAAERGISTTILYPETHCYQGGLAAAEMLTSESVAPDGVFCANDYLALGVIDGLKERLGNECMAQIKVAGFDDMQQSSWSSYQLTTVKQSTEEMAQHCVELLLSRIEDPDQTSRTRTLDVSLIKRKTL